jgi:endoglucanase
MKVLTKNGVIDGAIGFDPTSQYGQPKGLVEEDLWLDIGAADDKEASSKVQVGDLAVFAPRISAMGDKILCGTAIDDRIGLFVLDECLSWFSKHQIPVNLKFIGSAQEEVGLRGSPIIASNTALDACIVLDVDYATDTPTPHDNQMGSLLLGKGVGIHIKSDVSPVLRRIAIEVAEANQIAYQLSLGRFIYGGTDSTALQIQQNGIATLNMNIPCRYMHSPVEMCHKEDVESCTRLLIALVEELGRRRQNSFIPGID